MDARVELAAALPIRLGFRGARTTPADLARHKRAGLIASHSLPCLVRLIGEARADETRSRGRGNRAARRKRALALA